jgi:hypothetical protein
MSSQIHKPLLDTNCSAAPTAAQAAAADAPPRPAPAASLQSFLNNKVGSQSNANIFVTFLFLTTAPSIRFSSIISLQLQPSHRPYLPRSKPSISSALSASCTYTLSTRSQFIYSRKRAPKKTLSALRYSSFLLAHVFASSCRSSTLFRAISSSSARCAPQSESSKRQPHAPQGDDIPNVQFSRRLRARVWSIMVPFFAWQLTAILVVLLLLLWPAYKSNWPYSNHLQVPAARLSLFHLPAASNLVFSPAPQYPQTRSPSLFLPRRPGTSSTA